MGGSQVFLEEGEEMSVEELLKCTVIASANDAAVALAEHVGGSEALFVSMMNKRAEELGLENTFFENVTGLDDETKNHLTTAKDIGIMSCELIKYELIKKYSSLWQDTIRNGEFTLTNTNRLVRYYDGCNGLKTGSTDKAGYCISATANREGMELVAVVLGSDNSTERFEDAKKLLNWGFANYSVYEPQIDMSLITDVTVLCGEQDKITPVVKNPHSILIKKGTENSITQRVDLCVDVEAPVEKGQKLGAVYFEKDGEIIATCPIVSENAVQKRGVLFVFKILWSTFAKKS
jgi:D-alanyl-D-alanine carboxypeptidase (penicillin-binding protein 5/6)